MSKRPFIFFHVGASVDGRISLGPNRTMWDDVADVEKSGSREGAIYKDYEDRLRSLHKPQADLLGSNSIVAEGEELKPLPPYTGDSQGLYLDYLPQEVVEDKSIKGWLTVVDGRGRLRSGYKGDGGWHMLHLVSKGAPAEYLAFLREQKIPYLVAGEERVDLQEAMEKLYSLLGVTSVISSAGGKLGGAMLRAGLVDEVSIVFNPKLIGGFKTPSLFDSPDLERGEEPVQLGLIESQEQDGYVWVRYRLEV